MSRTLRMLGTALSALFVACGPTPSANRAATAEPGAVAVGRPAPPFSATAHDGTEVNLGALKGKHVVLYFYPKDETAVCTKEACSFRDAWKELAASGVVLVGISTDSLDAHRAFAEHYNLPFHLLSDSGGAIATAYGVPQRYRASNGVEYTGIFARQTFVIDPAGNVKRIYRSVDVGRHAQEIVGDVR